MLTFGILIFLAKDIYSSTIDPLTPALCKLYFPTPSPPPLGRHFDPPGDLLGFPVYTWSLGHWTSHVWDILTLRHFISRTFNQKIAPGFHIFFWGGGRCFVLTIIGTLAPPSQKNKSPHKNPAFFCLLYKRSSILCVLLGSL